MKSSRLGASFRDPSGFLFRCKDVLFRQVNQSYAAEYNQLMESGLYTRLVETGRLVPFVESDQPPAEEKTAFKVLRPEQVPFISYPYEWSFGQWKDAALATLAIQKQALKFGMTLKDASAYNIQFFHGKAALIDTLSFARYQDGQPWVAYRQFCQHFLAPLALMAYRDVRLGQLLRIHIDGVPLDLASSLLPGRTRWIPGLVVHLHLHARAQKRYSEVSLAEARSDRTMSRQAMLGVIENLRATIRRMEWKPTGTEWSEYYLGTNYSTAAFEHKQRLVGEWLAEIKPGLVWDLGANTGVFSRIAAEAGSFTVAFDLDPGAVEQSYRAGKLAKEQNYLPLLLDLTNPSPAIGWHNRERDAFLERGPADLVLGLALVHHLAIRNNVPLPQMAAFFADCGEWLIVEFVPKSDSQVGRLLRSREDIFPDYTRAGFEAAFGALFEVAQVSKVVDSERWLYLMKKKEEL
ncbi:MAG: hypothetical protein JXB85_07425 [Anaerolineales bacterium]|nr:hypothetical protein [Anaerolineales bacterium]